MSIFRTNDSETPWDNGWATDDAAPPSPQLGSLAFLSPSQLLSGGAAAAAAAADPLADAGASAPAAPAAVPDNYKLIYSHIGNACSTTNELEHNVFNKLVASDELSPYQKTRIIDVMYDHNLLPPSREANFYQILGLVALELDLPGTGDFVTLQFRRNSLPPLPQHVVTLLTLAEDPLAPLPPQQRDFGALANTTDDAGPRSSAADPILTDHSSIQREGKPVADEPLSLAEITKYVADLRGGYRPTVGPRDLVRIKEVPEKEGLLFKHTNYIIAHELSLGLQSPAGTKKVIRRYLDFVWYVPLHRVRP